MGKKIIPDITHIHVGRRANIKENLEHNWEELDINNFTFPQSKMIFVFGGNTTNRADAANGNAKIVESLLTPTNREKFNIYSFRYDSEPLKAPGYLLREYEEELHHLYQKMFKPLLFDKSGKLKEKQGLEKVFKNIIFVSHCGGSNFMDLLIDDIYETLAQHNSPAMAEILTNKIQYLTYAPNEMPNHSVNSLVIAPFVDVGNSWIKALSFAQDKRVDTDYPKGVVKKFQKSQNQGYSLETFDENFEGKPVVTFKSGQTICMIPSRMNPNMSVGDHSIECLTKPHILDANTPFANTAKIANKTAKIVLNLFAENVPFDAKRAYDKVMDNVYSRLPDTIK